MSLIYGRDVSDYQMPAQWEVLHPQFLGVRLTEGEHTADKRAAAHISAAGVELPLILYHFGWPIESPGVQADFFTKHVRLVAGHRPVALALDLEPYGDECNVKGMTASKIQAWASAWIHDVQHQLPEGIHRIGVYASVSIFQRGWVPPHASFNWAAKYPHEFSVKNWPEIRGYDKPLIWQYSSAGVDRDVCGMSTSARLAAWMWNEGTTAGGHVRRTYRAVAGDNLSVIAQRHGLTLAEIEHYNPQIKNFNLIYPGETIYLSE